MPSRPVAYAEIVPMLMTVRGNLIAGAVVGVLALVGWLLTGGALPGAIVLALLVGAIAAVLAYAAGQLILAARSR